MPFSFNKLLPRFQKVINANNIFKCMNQLNFHSSESVKSIHTHTHTQQVLPIIQRFVAVYKLWNELRNNIAKQSRFTLGAKLENLFLDTMELLFIASYLGKEQKLPVLQKANSKLDLLKFFLQIAWEVKVLDTKKYIELSGALDEIGRMLGGWRKGLESKTPAKA